MFANTHKRRQQASQGFSVVVGGRFRVEEGAMEVINSFPAKPSRNCNPTKPKISDGLVLAQYLRQTRLQWSRICPPRPFTMVEIATTNKNPDSAIARAQRGLTAAALPMVLHVKEKDGFWPPGRDEFSTAGTLVTSSILHQCSRCSVITNKSTQNLFR